jgi:hypothetical protein
MSTTPIPRLLRQAISKRAKFRCSYCRTFEAITGALFTVDHIIPESLGGPTSLENLCLACWPCNLRKGNRLTAIDPDTGQHARLFHPNQQQWSEHFVWAEDGLLVIGRSPTGRATVDALQMNDPEHVNGRRIWIRAGYHPPPD